MKKRLTIAALSSVFVLGAASAALAVHATSPSDNSAGPAVVASKGAALTMSGEVRARGYINKVNSAEDSAAATGYDTKVKLGVKAVVAPGATGMIELETAPDTGDTIGWGQEDGTSLHKGGEKIGGVEILQAWVNYQPGNTGVKVGHMPLALGNKVFFDHTGSGDDAVVVYTNLGESTHVAGLAIKFAENAGSDNSDDLDGYVGLITHKIDDNLSLGANWTYLRGGEDNDSPLSATDTTGFVAPGMAMSNIGLTADFKTGPISLSGDFEYQMGDFSDNGVTTSEVNGWALRLAGNMDLGGAKVGLVYGHGTGDDNDDSDVDFFVNFLTDTSYDTILANYRVSVPGTFTTYSGLSNLNLYQLNGSTSFTCPMSGKNVNMKGSLSYMSLSEDTNNYGTNMEDEVGIEVDAVLTWKLTPGLAYKVELAYMDTGDVWMTSADDNPDNLYFMRHGIDLKF